MSGCKYLTLFLGVSIVSSGTSHDDESDNVLSS